MHWTRPGRDIAQTVLSCLEWELCETLSQAGVSHVIARYKATWNLGHKRQSWQIAISMCFAVYCFRFGTRDNVASYPGPRTLSGESKLQAHFYRPGVSRRCLHFYLGHWSRRAHRGKLKVRIPKFWNSRIAKLGIILIEQARALLWEETYIQNWFIFIINFYTMALGLVMVCFWRRMHLLVIGLYHRPIFEFCDCTNMVRNNVNI